MRCVAMSITSTQHAEWFQSLVFDNPLNFLKLSFYINLVLESTWIDRI